LTGELDRFALERDLLNRDQWERMFTHQPALFSAMHQAHRQRSVAAALIRALR